MTETTDIAALEAQIDQARRKERERLEAADRERQNREAAYRRQRLAEYDRAALTRETRRAWGAFLDALAADPVFSALADAHAARWRERQAANAAHGDAVFLARVDGAEPPHDPGLSEPPPLTPDLLLGAVANLAAERIEATQAEIDETYAAAVYGDGLTEEQILTAEQEADAARRREAARINPRDEG